MARRIERFRELDTKELLIRERELGEELFRLRFQLASGQAEALKRLREVHRDLARVKTLLRERDLLAERKTDGH